MRPSATVQGENRQRRFPIQAGLIFRWASDGVGVALTFQAPRANHPTSWLSFRGPQPSGRFFPDFPKEISEHTFSPREGEDNRLFERDCLNIAFPPAGFVLPAETVGGGEVT